MYLRLRQVVVVAGDKPRTVESLSQLFGIHPVHGSGDLSPYGIPSPGPMSEQGRKLLEKQGIENLIFPLGRDFQEVLVPLRRDCSAGRYRARRGGDTGYMLVLQADDVDHFEGLAHQAGVRIVHKADFPKYKDIHLHTRDTGGALLSVARNHPDNQVDGAWYPAGKLWETMSPSPQILGLAGAELQSPDHQQLAHRWSRLLGAEREAIEEGFRVPIDNGELRFVEARDGRGEGFSGFDLRVANKADILLNARTLGFPVDGDVISALGMRIKAVT